MDLQFYLNSPNSKTQKHQYKMKKFTLSLTLMIVITSIIYSQTPQAIDYQAVVRDTDGAVLNSANVGVRVSILQESAFGTAVYVESHNVTTSQFGLINIAIGDGVVGSGDFSLIDWEGSDTQTLSTGIDRTASITIHFHKRNTQVLIDSLMVSNIVI